MRVCVQTNSEKRQLKLLGDKVRKNLSVDLLKEPWKSAVMQGANRYTGHCYVASEALWHALGGKNSGWVPACIKHEGSTHWYLTRGDEIVDLTDEQFQTPVEYAKGRRLGFLTKTPSKRAQTVLDRFA